MVLHAPTCATGDEKRDADFAETADFADFIPSTGSGRRRVNPCPFLERVEGLKLADAIDYVFSGCSNE